MLDEGLDPATSDAVECVVRKLHQLHFAAEGCDAKAVALHSWGGSSAASIVPRSHTLATLKLASMSKSVKDKTKAAGGAGHGGGAKGKGSWTKKYEKRAGGSQKAKPAGAHAP